MSETFNVHSTSARTADVKDVWLNPLPDDSLLVEETLYRNKVHVLGKHLVGGVSQLQSNCRTWELQGSVSEDNREMLERDACYTIQPKGILIIGRTDQLNTNNKRATFEIFRRSNHALSLA